MNLSRREFIVALAGFIAATVVDLPDIPALVIPESASLHLPQDSAFFLKCISFSNGDGFTRFTKPMLHFSNALLTGDINIQHQQRLNLELPVPYLLTPKEPIVLVGEPGTWVTLHGIHHDLTRKESLYYCYWLSI